MPTWSEPPLKALWTASTISQTLSMPLTASLVNRPSSSMLSCARSPPIWSHCVPNAANLALENVAQKTINYLPNLVKKCASHHTETSRRINPKCALSSCHSGLTVQGNLPNRAVSGEGYYAANLGTDDKGFSLLGNYLHVGAGIYLNGLDSAGIVAFINASIGGTFSIAPLLGA